MKHAILRGIIVGIGVILQLLLSLIIYLYLIDNLLLINILFGFIKIIVMINLIKNSKNYSKTLPLIIILLFFPLIGTLLYIIISQNQKYSKLRKTINSKEKDIEKYLKQDENIKKEIKNISRLRYIYEYAGYPISKNNELEYFKVGELAFTSMLNDLKNAKEYIFLEYFIISHGTMWNSILEILKEKASIGIDVRIMYDDAGCIATLKKNYYKELESFGIKCIPFNKLNPIRGVIMNNRDHRKIMIIDGKIAYTGGINLSDEYININSNYGHWKDNAIRIYGESVWSFTVMFLSIWNSFRQTDDDYTKFKREFSNILPNGYVAPYAQNPLTKEEIAQDIYINMINEAQTYLYIYTPYLIIDTEVINALTLAAKRGVDVRLIIPGIPDKKIVYTLSESYLPILIKSGVKIYKYTPGFIHSKVFLADDLMAVVGTINLDFRSLYLHFECALYIEKSNVIKDIKEDILETIEKSHLVTKKEATPRFLKSLWQTLLRLFAPLM